jgi:branched-chain amino acid transport system substrate-binding protein
MANMADPALSWQRRVTRRDVIKSMGVGALALGAGDALVACGVKGSSNTTSGTITIGYVSPLTGALAGFATGDNWVLNGIRQTDPYKNGFKLGSKTYSVNIVVKDTQSDPNRASQVARELILTNHVDMILTSSTPETTNPVADACEANGVPCVSTIVPWESWYFGRGAKPGTAFKYTTMFFFGLAEFGQCFIPMWDRMNSNKVVAGCYPNDADGNAFRDVNLGLPHYAAQAGYRVIDGGAYPDGTTDYTSIIAKFKSADAQIFTNAPIPPDFNTMWKQASQQGYRPKLATVAKVLLFPADTVAIGDLVNNVATDAWWTPYHPYSSTLTGQSCKQFADAFESATGKQWVQSIGSVHSLFEIAHKAFTAVDDPHNRTAVAGELKTLSYTGLSGPLDFSKGPVPGVAIIKPLGVQWQKGTRFPYEMKVVDNSANKNVPLNGELAPTNA